MKLNHSLALVAALAALAASASAQLRVLKSYRSTTASAYGDNGFDPPQYVSDVDDTYAFGSASLGAGVSLTVESVYAYPVAFQTSDVGRSLLTGEGRADANIYTSDYGQSGSASARSSYEVVFRVERVSVWRLTGSTSSFWSSGGGAGATVELLQGDQVIFSVTDEEFDYSRKLSPFSTYTLRVSAGAGAFRFDDPDFSSAAAFYDFRFRLATMK